MGVNGLWHLVESTGKPVPLETLDSKILAIDISIWLHQSLHGFRDVSGSTVPNAHILGLLHRISKILFYNVKPVFVFDGGVPTLKKKTMAIRRKLKSKAENETEKASKKILTNLLRQHAMKTVTGQGPIEPSSHPGPSTKKDLYQLEPLPEKVYESSSSSDEEERALVASIVRGRDIHSVDFISNEFKGLPPELQHEVLLELKDTRKQNSWGKLHMMPQEAGTFANFQMSRLLKRRALEERLTEVGDAIRSKQMDDVEKLYGHGSGHRIVSDETKRFILLKDFTADKATPKQETSSPKKLPPAESALVETSNEASPRKNLNSIFKKAYGKTSALETIAKLKSGTLTISDSEEEDEDEDNPPERQDQSLKDVSLAKKLMTEEEEELSQEELLSIIKSQNQKDGHKKTTTRDSKAFANLEKPTGSKTQRHYPELSLEYLEKDVVEVDDDDLEILEGSDKRNEYNSSKKNERSSRKFSTRKANEAGTKTFQAATQKTNSFEKSSTGSSIEIVIDPKKNFMEDDIFGDIFGPGPVSSSKGSIPPGDIFADIFNPEASKEDDTSKGGRGGVKESGDTEEWLDSSNALKDELIEKSAEEFMDVDKAMETDVPISNVGNTRLMDKDTEQESRIRQVDDDSEDSSSLGEQDSEKQDGVPEDVDMLSDESSRQSSGVKGDGERRSGEKKVNEVEDKEEEEGLKDEETENEGLKEEQAEEKEKEEEGLKEEESDEELSFTALISQQKSEEKTWDISHEKKDYFQEADSSEIKTVKEKVEDKREETEPVTMMDDSEEIPPEELDRIEQETKKFAEEFAQRGYSDMLTHLKDEKEHLSSERGRQERIANTVTDQMYVEAKELLKLFGLPYVTSPLEAEAQCAFLDYVGLTHGTITDDSDIWLFGGQRVYRNFFNNNKFVEFYKSQDLLRAFSLTRQKMVTLAILAGSDYTPGIFNVGPVTAMEIMAEFPGEGLQQLRNFKSWWDNARQEKVAPAAETRVKKRCRTLFLSKEFPDPDVIEAYLSPEVDSSTEKFKWGRPNLEGIREFIKNKLGWSQEKLDGLILPVIKKLQDRTTQMRIDAYFAAELPSVQKSPSKRVQRALYIKSKKAEASAPITPVKVAPESATKSKKRTKSKKGDGGPSKKSKTKEETTDEKEIPVPLGDDGLVDLRAKARIEARQKVIATYKASQAKKGKGNRGRGRGTRLPQRGPNLSESSSDSD